MSHILIICQHFHHPSITLARGDGFESLMRVLTYGAVFWLALQWGRDRERARNILVALVLAGVAYGFYGLVMYLGEYRMVLWVEDAPYGAHVTSTFINRNSYATYAVLGLLCTAGLYLESFFKALHSGRR